MREGVKGEVRLYGVKKRFALAETRTPNPL